MTTHPRPDPDERRQLTADEIEAQRRGGTRLAAGFWTDAEGYLHVSVPELLAHFDLEDTPANRDEMERLILEQFRAVAPDAKIIRQD